MRGQILKILLAEDDRFTRKVTQDMLESYGFSVRTAADGKEAWEQFIEEKPNVIITDWMMPNLSGIDLVKRVRAFDETSYTYTIMVTAKNRKDDMLTGMEAGVDDFLGKPFHRQELRMRLRAAERILNLHRALADRITELEDLNRHVQTLQGFLPICAYCKNVRNDNDFWERLDYYIAERNDALKFSHSICPDCYETHVKPMEEQLMQLTKPTPELPDLKAAMLNTSL